MLNKEILTVSLKLFIITSLAALCLAVVNKITMPIIAENNAAIEVRLKQEVLPEAVEFQSGEIPQLDTDNVTIEKINVGLGKSDGSVCGYVVTAISHAGYGGDLKVMVGIDKNFRVTRVKIMESSETAGLGANASKPGFIDQFAGADKHLSVVKGEAGATEISAIASATVTSKAVTACVNAAMDAAKEKGKSGKIEETAKKFEEIKQETKAQLSETGGGDDK